MNYISVAQAAQKWDISQARVHEMCETGLIPGVARFENAWMIPENTEASAIMGSKQSLQDNRSKNKGLAHIPMPLLNTPFKLGCGLDTAMSIKDVDARNIALAEYYYFSGQSTKASDLAKPYIASDDIALCVSACWIYAYANLALDRIPRARMAMARIQEIVASVDENTSPTEKALAICVSTAASVLLHLPLPKILSPLKSYIHMMPPGLRLFVLYVEAHHSYLNKQYGACVGVAETALALEGELYPIPTIYLHLVASMGYINLKHPEMAKQHLLEAWEIAEADDLIEAFGEHHGLLCGMLEAVIKKEWPEAFQRMIGITYSFSAGWRKIHNPDTGNRVADDLTTTEFAIAMLAARDWTNKEISAHLGISVNTVKLHISSALQKLGISQRKELAQFMLK